MTNVETLIRSVAVAVLAIFVQVGGSSNSIAQTPLGFHRENSHCPPVPEPKPEEGLDKFTPGPPPVVTEWLIARYHWDDGHGDDLTVDVICVVSSNSFSLRVTQSKDGKNTVIAEPGGTGVISEPGECCEFLNGSNVGPKFGLPAESEKDDVYIPTLITWINKDPHEPGKAASNLLYHKTFIWLIPGRAIIGWINVDYPSGEVHYEGEFVTPSSPNGKKADALDSPTPSGEKKRLLKLFCEEKPAVDEQERKRFRGMDELKKKLAKAKGKTYVEPNPCKRWF